MSAIRTKPVLLYNDECAVCRHVARWVQAAAERHSREMRFIERPIGDDPDALRALSPDLDIWAAYATVHLLMPDGSMKLGGEAVAEIFRRLPQTEWLARSLSLSIFGWRPFQMLLNLSYTILADVRPLFGCESCGMPSAWLKPLVWVVAKIGAIFGRRGRPVSSRHFSAKSPPEPKRIAATPT
jgi:predicted DCC family thiol-disulfide oxidoreductase YuxK